jgi:hypothetical protein
MLSLADLTPTPLISNIQGNINMSEYALRSTKEIDMRTDINIFADKRM